jgi:hypothetical protein
VNAANSRRNLVPLWLSALVWPGAGQVYAGKRGKGIALIVLSGLLTLVFSVVAAICILQASPPGSATLLDPGEVRLALHRLAVEDTGTLLLAASPLAVVWLYAVLDAWRESGPRP